MLGRTLMQPAQVISFGFKVVAWVAPLVRARERLRAAARAALQLQLGGAVGTLAALGDKGAGGRAPHGRRSSACAVPPAPGTRSATTGSRSAARSALLCGSLGKIAHDLSLLAQGEVGEVAEPTGGGRGGSSAMPHKRNPVASMVAIAAAMRAPHRVAALLAAMPQEHERGLGDWQAELAEWPALFMRRTARSRWPMRRRAQVDAARMRATSSAARPGVRRGAAMLLAPTSASRGACAASRPVARVAERRTCATCARGAADAELAPIDADALDALFDADAAARRASALRRSSPTGARRRRRPP